MTTSDSTQPEDYTILVDTREKNHSSLIIISGVLLLLILGALWLFIPEDEEIELAPPLQQGEIDPIVRAQIDAANQAPKAQKSVQAEDAATTEIASFEAGQSKQTQVASLTPTPTLQAKDAQHPGDLARDIIRSAKQSGQNQSMQQLFDEAQQFAQGGQGTDAYLLYFYAARQGHGPSAFALAEMNDPAYFKKGNDLLEQPDPMQAYKWYSMAAASQVDQAAERLSKLRAGVESAAAAGDPSAQRLLLNWK